MIFKSDELTVKLSGKEATLLLILMEDAAVNDAESATLIAIEAKLMHAEREQQAKPQPKQVAKKKIVSKFGQQTMRLIDVVDEKTSVQSNGDRRYRCNRMVCSYLGADGHEYRKSFEFKMDRFEPPTSGTSDELNRLGRVIHQTQPKYK